MFIFIKSRQKQAFSLLELLVATFIGVLFLEVIINCYGLVNKISREQEERVVLHTNLRIASFLLWQHIMQAASYSGSNAQGTPTLAGFGGIVGRHGIFGYADDSINLPGVLRNKVVGGSDVIEIVKSRGIGKAGAEKIIFFIGKAHRLDSKGKHVAALYMFTNGEDLVELTPGVERMEIVYGHREGSRIVYYSAPEITSQTLWGEVMLVKIRIFLSGEKLVLANDIYIRLRMRDRIGSS